MDSDEGYNYEFDDEEEECSEDSAEEEADDDALDLGEVELVEPEVAGGERDGCEEPGSGGGGGGGGGGLGAGRDEEDYRYEVLTAEQILQHMVECIREVNEVIQVAGTRKLSVRFCAPTFILIILLLLLIIRLCSVIEAVSSPLSRVYLLLAQDSGIIYHTLSSVLC